MSKRTAGQHQDDGHVVVVVVVVGDWVWVFLR